MSLSFSDSFLEPLSEPEPESESESVSESELDLLEILFSFLSLLFFLCLLPLLSKLESEEVESELDSSLVVLICSGCARLPLLGSLCLRGRLRHRLGNRLIRDFQDTLRVLALAVVRGFVEEMGWSI